MQRTKKRNKAALVLPVLLVGSGILVACIGLSLKAKLKEDGRYGEQMAVAVPFLMMQERDSLKPLQSPITEPSSPSQPPESTPPAVQTEPTEPSEEATEATAPPPVYGRTSPGLTMRFSLEIPAWWVCPCMPAWAKRTTLPGGAQCVSALFPNCFRYRLWGN